MTLVAMAAALACVGGNCQQPVVPTPDASDGAVEGTPTPPTPPPPVDDCTAACAALAALGCYVIGDAADCASFLARDLGSNKVTDSTGHIVHCSDVRKLTSKSAAQDIGFVCK